MAVSARKRSDRKLALLYEVSRTVVSNSYLEDILGMVVVLTADLMGSKICSLMLLDEARHELVIKATQSLSLAYRGKPPFKVGESVSGRAVVEKRPITVLDVQNEPGYKYPQIARAEGLRSMVAVPLMVKGRVIGVLNCYTTSPHAFGEDEIQTLVSVANQAALAIENTRLLSEKVAALDELETRKKIERAKGIVMKRLSLAEDQAYRFLQKMSMDKRKTLKEVAESVVVSEEIG